MGSFLLHMAIRYMEHSMGREDPEGQMLTLAFRAQCMSYLGRIRLPAFRTPRAPRAPQTPPRIPSAPSRPGLPIALVAGAGAIVHKAGSFLWSYRWWIAAGVGAYLLGSYVRNYLWRHRSNREQHFVDPHAVRTSRDAYILDGSAVLSAYLEEILKSDSVTGWGWIRSEVVVVVCGRFGAIITSTYSRERG